MYKMDVNNVEPCCNYFSRCTFYCVYGVICCSNCFAYVNIPLYSEKRYTEELVKLLVSDTDWL